MKKWTLWGMIPVFWLLCFSTFFSAHVQDWMMPTIVNYSPNEPFFPMDILFYHDGVPTVYQSYEGLVWEKGTRVREVSPNQYVITPSEVKGSGLLSAVRYASNQPVSGGAVKIVAALETGPDSLLLISYDDFATLQVPLPEGVTELGRAGAALLLSVSQADVPFLPDKAASSLLEQDPYTGYQGKVYSLSEVEKFFRQLPLLAVPVGLAIALLFLWVVSAFFLKRPKQARALFLLNLAVSVLALLGAVSVLGGIDFPSSLLPQERLIDFPHYGQMFSDIFSALIELESAEDQTAANLLSLVRGSVDTVKMILLSGALCGAVCSTVEWLIFRRRVRKSSVKKEM